MLRSVERALVLVHRYVGIAVGPLMLLWCLTGIVMMYAPYPQIAEAERVAHLSPVDWAGCCRVGDALSSPDTAFARFQVEGLNGQAVLRVTSPRGASQLVRLSDGQLLASVDEASARKIATAYTTEPEPLRVTPLDHDQWTVQGAHGPDRPLWKIAGELGTDVYVSSVSGKVIQRTDAGERFWNWIGTVPHWLYFTRLRQNGHLWTEVVVWTSTVGTFLTLIGLYIGIRQFRRGAGGNWIPYPGFHYWHHALGLLFGVFVLTWVFSGLVSMNPWGFLEGGDFDEPERLEGLKLTASGIAASVAALGQSAPPDVVSVTSAPLHGDLYLVATHADGSRVRLDAQGRPAPLSAADRDFVARTLDPMAKAASLELISREDDYYFSHQRDHAEMPSFRVVASDSERTRFYLDPVSGQIRAKIDGDNQKYRWLHQGLHRLDFSPLWRSRPLWDVVMLTLLAGATAVCALGTWIGIRRLTR